MVLSWVVGLTSFVFCYIIFSHTNYYRSTKKSLSYGRLCFFFLHNSSTRKNYLHAYIAPSEQCTLNSLAEDNSQILNRKNISELGFYFILFYFGRNWMEKMPDWQITSM